MRYIAYTSSSRPSLLQKAAAIIVTGVVAGIALMFSAVFFVVILIVGTVAGAYLWWKTREIRKQMEVRMQQFQSHNETQESEVFRGEVFEGEIIEGEAIHVGTDKETH